MSSSSCCSTIIVSTHRHHQISFRSLTVALHSCDGKAREEEVRHKVVRLQTGENTGRFFSVSTPSILPICVIASTPGPFEARGMRGYLNPSKTQIVNLPRQGRRRDLLSIRIRRAKYHRQPSGNVPLHDHPRRASRWFIYAVCGH